MTFVANYDICRLQGLSQYPFTSSLDLWEAPLQHLLHPWVSGEHHHNIYSFLGSLGSITTTFTPSLGLKGASIS